MNLFSTIKEDWIAHGKEWTRPGFRAIAFCRFGYWRTHQIQNRYLRFPFNFLYRILYRHARNVYGIEIPSSVELGRRVVIEHQGGIVIHGCAKIGDDSIVRQNVTIGNRYLDRPLEAPVLGKRVNVGAGAVILGNIEIGDDAVIGANAVVIKDVAPGSTVVGIPAKPLK